jgi:aspartate aminotransferase
MQKALYQKLVRLNTPGKWEYIAKQTGMFSYTGVDTEQIERLRVEHDVFKLPSGRAQYAG